MKNSILRSVFEEIPEEKILELIEPKKNPVITELLSNIKKLGTTVSVDSEWSIYYYYKCFTGSRAGNHPCSFLEMQSAIHLVISEILTSDQEDYLIAHYERSIRGFTVRSKDFKSTEFKVKNWLNSYYPELTITREFMYNLIWQFGLNKFQIPTNQKFFFLDQQGELFGSNFRIRLSSNVIEDHERLVTGDLQCIRKYVGTNQGNYKLYLPNEKLLMNIIVN